MKLHLARPAGQNLITGYGVDYVAVNDTRYGGNLLVLSTHIVESWAQGGFDELVATDFEALLELKPEIVLLGTGKRLRFPHPSITRALADARVGLEVMDMPAACRTYNILMSEGRNVLAALLLA